MEDLVRQLAQQAQERYYGKYRGYVVDNQDEEKRGRLRITVPEVLGDTVTSWALPCMPFGGLADQGFFMVPELESAVWVEFEAGDLRRPIWTGVFWRQSSDVPSEAQKDEPTTRMLKTPSGHILQFDDAEGEEKFRLYHPSEAEMSIDENGSVKITDAQGNTVDLDASAGKIKIEDKNGNSLTMDASGIKIEDKNGNKIDMAAAGITITGAKINVG